VTSAVDDPGTSKSPTPAMRTIVSSMCQVEDFNFNGPTVAAVCRWVAPSALLSQIGLNLDGFRGSDKREKELRATKPSGGVKEDQLPFEAKWSSS